MRPSDVDVTRPRAGVRQTVCRRPAVVQHDSCGQTQWPLRCQGARWRTLLCDSTTRFTQGADMLRRARKVRGKHWIRPSTFKFPPDPAASKTPSVCPGGFEQQALCRTRTDDPFLTMEILGAKMTVHRPVTHGHESPANVRPPGGPRVITAQSQVRVDYTGKCRSIGSLVGRAKFLDGRCSPDARPLAGPPSVLRRVARLTRWERRSPLRLDGALEPCFLCRRPPALPPCRCSAVFRQYIPRGGADRAVRFLEFFTTYTARRGTCLSPRSTHRDGGNAFSKDFDWTVGQLVY